MRVFELADALGVTPDRVLEVCASLGVAGAWSGGELSAEDAERVRADPSLPHRVAPAIPTSAYGFGAHPTATGDAGFELGSGTSTVSGGGPGPDLAVGAWAASGPIDHRMIAVPAAGTPLPARPLAPQFAHTTGKVNLGRRDPRVGYGWARVGRAVVIWVGTYVATVFFGMWVGVAAGISGGLPMGDERAKLALMVVPWLGAYLAGTGWAALTAIHGTIGAVAAWRPIGESEGTLTGRVSIVVLVAISGLMSLWWVDGLFHAIDVLIHI